MAAKELLAFDTVPSLLHGIQKGHARCEHCGVALRYYAVLAHSGVTYKVGEDCAIKLLLGFSREVFNKYKPHCLKAMRMARKYPPELYSMRMFDEVHTVLWQRHSSPGEIHKLSFSGMKDAESITKAVKAYLILKL